MSLPGSWAHDASMVTARTWLETVELW